MKISRPRARTIGALMTSVALVATLPQAALAQSGSGATQQIDIAAQPLENALLAIGREFGVAVVAPNELVSGKTAPRVSGSLSATEALSRVLAGSGLGVRQTSSGDFVIAGTSKDVSEVLNAEEIVVTGNREYLYRVENAKTFGINLPLKDLPLTVNVLTEDFIEDSAALEIQDLIAFVPGVSAGEEGGGVGHGVNIRGFENEIRLVNGSRQNLDITRSVMTTELFERVEIVKGPAGAEVGAADGGGLINYITKKPQSEFAAEVFAGIGDFGYRRIGGDITGPITNDGKLRYRFIGAYTELQ